MTFSNSIPVLERTSLQEFLAQARRMEHDEAALLRGEEIKTHFKLEDFARARAVLSQATPAQRKLRLATFFSDAHRRRARLGQGKHDRGEAVLFAAAPNPIQMDKGTSRHFPLPTQGISVLHKVVRSGETWDVSLPESVFAMGEMEELYSVVNVGTLVLEKGARVVVRGNVFSLLCQHLVTEHVPESEIDFNLGILPTPFSVDFGHGPHNGQDGIPGTRGLDGIDGAPGQLASGTLGPWVPDQPTESMHATDATDGGHGGDGGRGRNGGMCKVAEITIRRLTGRLRLFSQAGAGGNGGHGGDGGDGGHGGDGAPELRGFNRTVPGGYAGRGGCGGNAGRGHHGGHGGLASNIYLWVPVEAVPQATMVSLDSEGGVGGRGGRPGRGGRNGLPGVSTDSPAAAPAGRHCSDGQVGADGVNGRGRPAAPIFLNDLPYELNQPLQQQQRIHKR